ncbi:hypothetical protein [Streptomyces chryseus]|uniref:hypothetical protein n=1 Tax=Streptomyces chryseus TaxID=68186 RepID=UPI00110F9D9D|nr:hypothetical protein [Streptomyces chryseus]GGX26581.1 hypothetical protein GCM10010353_47030 [Streptomyces chryseus]
MESIVQSVTVEARDIRRGDVFDRHRKTWTATGAAGWGPYGSVRVPTEGGGEVFIPKAAKVAVTRVVRRAPCGTE